MATAIKWAYRYGSMDAEIFDDETDAINSAGYASEAGEEALRCIEIPAENRIISADEALRIADDRMAMNEPTYVSRPAIGELVVDQIDTDSKPARFRYGNPEQMRSEATRWVALVGEDRVHVNLYDSAAAV